jgi:hypothetical protein
VTCARSGVASATVPMMSKRRRFPIRTREI